MKRLLCILWTLLVCLTLCACSNEKEQEVINEPVGMANPVVEYSSLDEINEKIDVKLLKPLDVEVTNERFSIIDNRIAQYECEMYGRQWTFRAAHISDEDISGMYSEYNQFEQNQDFRLYVNEFYLERYFDGDKQYTAVVLEPITEDGELLLGEEIFGELCLDLELIQKYHMDDPFVGEFRSEKDERMVIYVERFADEYNIGINLNLSDYETICWTVYGTSNEDDKLKYQTIEYGHYIYDSEGNFTTNEEETLNQEGYFELNNNILHWVDDALEEYATYEFEKVIYEE